MGRQRMRVGLSGGIGSGKSEVAKRFASLGALVVDADGIAREVVAPGTAGLAAVVEEFGRDILNPDGCLDRPALARIVFSDPARRRVLEEITHPLINARSAEIETAAAAGTVVVFDSPLLAENYRPGVYDVVVIVDTPDPLRLERLEKRGMPPADARRRMEVQASRADRLAIADHVIDNSGDLATLHSQVDALWHDLIGACRPDEE